MSQCQSGSDTYLNYYCYELLKPKFDNIDLGLYGPEYLAEAREQITKKYPNQLERYETFFEDISSCLQHDAVFIDADRRIPCSYINYLLNKKLRVKDMHSSNANFELLKDFVKEYHIAKGSRSNAHTCTSEIKSLDYEAFHRMTLLYQLYDDYTTVLKNSKPNDNNTCNILSKIILNYNDSITRYQTTDEKLIKKLIELKELIGKNVLPKNKGCKKEITYFNLSDIENKKIEEEKRIKREEEERIKREEDERIKREAEERIKREEDERIKREAEERIKREAKERIAQAKQLEQEQFKRVELQGHLQTRPLRLESNEQGQQYGVSYIKAQLLPHIKENGLAESYDSQTLGESEHSEIKMEQLQDQGLLGQMQNAFSSIVRNVDPAPVLGVSGGMGVLFILFKYTPVGSFFGGRRGRFRQIPRTFGGFPPGYFGNFQEYDGGLIGYSPMSISSLAE